MAAEIPQARHETNDAGKRHNQGTTLQQDSQLSDDPEKEVLAGEDDPDLQKTLREASAPAIAVTESFGQQADTKSSLNSGNSPDQASKDGALVDIEKGSDEVGTDEPDPNVVWWDGPDDPQNPMNFSQFQKNMTIVLVSSITFVTPLASSMFAPGVPQLMREFHVTNADLGSFVVSIYVLGFAVGPLLFAPLSEIYGRLPVYHLCNSLFFVFTIACALATNMNMLIGFRFLEGIAGSAPLTNGGGTIADIIPQEKRGRSMAFFAMGPIMGPIIGPVAGGFLSQAKGWRWVFWLLAMIGGFFAILSFIFMRETYAPVILQKRTNRLRKETGNKELRSKLKSRHSYGEFFRLSIVRPAKLLIFSPIVLSTSIYCGVVFGYLYLLFTTFPSVFEGTYGFSSGTVGLTYLGLGVGSLSALIYFGIFSDRNIKKRTAEADAIAAANGEVSAGMKPEYRLPLMIPGAALIPLGLLIYGWTTRYHVHWIVPILATALIGFGNLSVMMCIMTYLVDAFTIYAASALAANTVIRSIMGAVLPLAGPKMYKALGLGWGNSLLAFLALALLPTAFVLVRWGENMRKRFDLSRL